MGQNSKKKTPSHLDRTSQTDDSILVNQVKENKSTVVSASTYEKFQAESEARMERLKQELEGILALVRGYTQQRTLEDVEARLIALREKIEKEMKE